MNRLISLICAVMITFSSAYAYDITFYDKVENPDLNLPAPVLPATADGSVLLEAEDGTMSKNTTVVTDAGASGATAVKFTPGAWASTVAASEPNPTLKLDFEVTEADSFTVWGYIKAATAGSDSVYVTANSDLYTSLYLTASSSWQWVKLTTVVLDEGAAFIAFKYREIGFMIDKVVVTNNVQFAPKAKDDYPVSGNSEGLSDIFPEPSIKPIDGHPRVFLTPEYVEKLKAYVNDPEIAPAWQSVKNTAGQNLTSELPSNPSGNYDAGVVNWIQCRALLYALGEKDAAWAKETITHARNMLRTVTFPNISDITRQMGTVMTMGAVVYDWCYDYMTDDDKTYFIKRFKQICSIKEIGYPPVANICGIGGHMGEYEIHRDMLSCGIACYDEDPEMYNLGAGALLSRYTESRRLFNSSGNHPNGSAYGLFRLGCELYADLLFTRMGYPGVYGEEMSNVMLRYLYARRPDGLILKDGDDYEYSSRSDVTDYAINDWTALIILNALYDEPYTRGQFVSELAMQGYSKDAFWLVVCADPGKEFDYSDSLPTAYKTSYPLTSVFHRTSWQSGLDSDAAMAQFKAYERHIGDHMHLDTGSFQIYYKGALAIDAGNYQGKGGGYYSAHDLNYNKRSISHNLITVYDPNETFILNSSQYANDGGQRLRKTTVINDYETLMSDDQLYAETKGTYIGPSEQTPAFSYLKSNLAPAYSDKVTDYSRSMVFIDLFDEDYPAAFVVFDNITSSDKTFEKNWLLHSIEEPVVDGNTTTISRTEDGYSGKLVNKTLLPSDFTIDKIGGEGKDSYVDGQNYPNADSGKSNSEQGQWRIELSPAKANENDIFLNAMYVTDAAKNLPELPMYQESMSGMTGVTVKDRMVMFAKNAETQSSNLALTVRDNGYSDVMCFVADLAEGTWNVSGEGVSINVESKAGEEAICFTVKPGSYILSKTTAAADSITYDDVSKDKYGDFLVYDRVDGAYLKIEVPNKIINGVPYVAVRSMFAQLGADVEWDSTRGCAVVSENGISIDLYDGALSYTLNDGVKALSAPVIVENGTMFVPITDFEDFFSFAITYDSPAKILNVSVTEISPEILSTVDIYTDVIKPVNITASGNDGNVETNIADFSFETRWSCEGTDTWLLYDLGASYDISKIYMAFYNGNKRKTIYDIAVSNDGITYTTVFAGESSGTTSGLEALNIDANARYIKFMGHGTNLAGNTWNSVSEMIVTR